MTTTPLPPSGSNFSMQRAGNGYAVGSLILSLVGFCLWFVGGLLGMILGIMGLQRSRVTGTGRGLSIAGIIIGALSIFFSVGGTMTVHRAYVVAHKAVDAVLAPRTTVVNYLTDLSKNDVDAALAETSSLSKDDVAAHAAVVQPLGAYKDISSPNLNIVNNTAKVSGIATFANGTKSFDAELTNVGSKWKITAIKFQ